MSEPNQCQWKPHVYKGLIGGVACAIVSSVLNPVDVVRTRMQNQTGKCVIKYPSFTSGLSIIAKEEGFSGLGSGITSSIWRELVYSSIRMGGYEPIRGRIATILDHDPKQTNPLVKYFSAWVSGGVGAAIANPFDLIKTRLQAILPTEVGPYKGTIDAIIKIVKHDGVAGLYKGWAVNSVRAAVLTSSQLGTYDSIKNNIMIKVFHLQEGFLLHLCASMTAGLISTTVTNPVDVVKTRYMTNKGGKFRNPFECTLYVFRHEGFHGFFKGWTASYFRIGPHTVFSLLMIEELRSLLGINSL